MKKILLKLPQRLLLFLSFTIFVQIVFCESLKNSNKSQIDKLELSAQQLESESQTLGLQWNRNLISQAIETYIETSEKWKKLKNKNKAASCLREAGRLWIILGKKQKAKQLFYQALKIIDNTEFFDEKAKLFSDLSLLFLDEGQMNNSRSFFKNALILAQKANSPSAQAMALFSAGEFYYFRNDIDKSLNSYKQSIEFWQIDGNLRGEAKSIISLGYLHLIKSEYNLALNALNTALTKYQEAQDLRGQALTLKAIGTIFNHMNENQKALEYFQKAEQIFPEDIDYTEKASLYNWFGKAFEDYGEWHLSFSYRKKALELFEKDNHLYGQLATLPSLGKLSHLIGNNASAINYLNQAQQLALKIDDKFYLATINEEMCSIYFKSGDYQKSISYCEKSLTLFQKDIYQKQIARVLNTMGQINEKQNNILQAKFFYHSALKLNKNIRDKFGEAETLYNLARVAGSTEKDEHLLNLAKDSVQITESLYLEVLNSKLKSTYFSNVYDRYELYINLLMKMHKQSPDENYAIQALQAAERSRARSLLETLRLSEANFTKDADPELVQREKEIRALLNFKADKLTELLSSEADKAETDKLDNDINSLQSELEDIKGRLKANSPIYSAIKNPSDFDIKDFQANVLDDKTLLLEFSFGAEESFLWLVGKNEVSHYTLPKREILESRIQKLLDLLKAREITANEEPEAYQQRLIDAESEFQNEARLLSSELFGQIAGKLGNNRLIIVPDGKLNYFPVSALTLPDSVDNEPILMTNEIVYEPSAATLQILEKIRRPERSSTKEILIFADPIFSLADNRLSLENKNSTDEDDMTFFVNSLRSFNLTDSNNRLSRLFATGKEAESIAEIVGASNATIASGFAANRQRVFEKDVSDYKIIHFATHGLMNETRPELSGVVLSLFDEKGEAQKGFIRLQDIYSLNLSSDLVVLSACQSGIGKEVKGEGLMSLTGGFIQAGAGSVLSSLWKVDDYATAELMKNFYRELSAKNLAPSEALRNAQIKLRQNPNFNSPFYWAGFTVQGEFRQPISLGSYRFSYLRIFGTAFFAGLMIYFVFRFAKKH